MGYSVVVVILPGYYWVLLSLTLSYELGHFFEQVIFTLVIFHLDRILIFGPHNLSCVFLGHFFIYLPYMSLVMTLR